VTEEDDELKRFPYTAEYSTEFDSYFFALGDMAVRWSLFEFGINDAIWELANVSRMAGTCMTSQLIGPGPRFRCLVALLHLRETPQELIDEINSISGQADKLGRRRNRYLHDPMVHHRVDKTVYRIETTADRTLKHEIVPIEIDELDKLTEAIDQLRSSFLQVIGRIVDETPPWPRTEYEQSEGIRRDRPAPKTPPSEPQPPPEG
jgi:hypothetical protein